MLGVNLDMGGLKEEDPHQTGATGKTNGIVQSTHVDAKYMTTSWEMCQSLLLGMQIDKNMAQHIRPFIL